MVSCLVQDITSLCVDVFVDIHIFKIPVRRPKKEEIQDEWQHHK